jgi:hypothetical protein
MVLKAVGYSASTGVYHVEVRRGKEPQLYFYRLGPFAVLKSTVRMLA